MTAGDAGIIAKNLNVLNEIYSRSKFMKSIFDKLEAGSDFITEQEYTILSIEDNRKHRYIQQKMRNIRIINLGEYSIAYVFAENHISELGNYICKNIDGIRFVAIINTDTEVVSLRAVKESDIDLSEVAKNLSNNRGGGHPLSAGFVYDSSFNDNLIKDIFKISQ